MKSEDQRRPTFNDVHANISPVFASAPQKINNAQVSLNQPSQGNYVQKNQIPKIPIKPVPGNSVNPERSQINASMT